MMGDNGFDIQNSFNCLVPLSVEELWELPVKSPSDHNHPPVLNLVTFNSL